MKLKLDMYQFHQPFGKSMAVSRSYRQTIQQFTWLILAIICMFAALVFWGMTDQKDELVEVKPEKVETQVQIQPEKVAATAHLGALSDEVKPLDLTMRVVVANEHAPEFRGTKFIQDNKRQWGMEIFRSSDETIIKNFLLNRTDRKKFNYLRLTSPDQAEQYVLLYGVFANADEAKNQFAQLNLPLPKSIEATPQPYARYASFVNDLGSDELKTSTSPLYAIQLKAVALPKVDETLLMNGVAAGGRSSVVNDGSTVPLTTVKTTVVQRDAQGNVVDVKRSQSVVQPAQNAEKISENSGNLKSEQSDPFN